MVMQKRQEIEDQLHVFFEKCDRVVSVIEKMKQHVSIVKAVSTARYSKTRSQKLC